jgi:ADP-heptose:LPS heptosyltransferase
MKKVLVIQTASIGDVILATALVETIHTSFPDAAIDFMVKKGNEPLFRDHPYLNAVIVWEKRTRKYAGFLEILRRVRKAKYDLVVNVQRFFLTGLLTALSGGRETRGFAKNPLAFLFTRRFDHPIQDGVHEVTRNNILVSDLAVNCIPHPRLYPSEADAAAVKPFIDRVFHTISPASLWFTKQYPVEKWAELIRQIPPEETVYLTGASADQPLCDEIISLAGHPGTTCLAGKLTLLQSAALMKHAKMNFTNDSAPMHLASAVNAPVTAIYCSTVPGFGFGPLSDRSTVIEVMESLPCRPCGLHGFRACPEKHFNCAYKIKVEQLISKL